jgi:excisionase family DNA binding protein
MDDSKTVDITGDGRLWSVGQAADLLSVTTKTVYRHIQDGMVGSVRVGPRLLRIPHTELMAFLQIRSKKKVG